MLFDGLAMATGVTQLYSFYEIWSVYCQTEWHNM